MTEFVLEVDGPPGEADALLRRLQAAANLNDFAVEARARPTGALSGIEIIVATIGSVAAVASFVWEIVKHRQHTLKTTGPKSELHIHLHYGEKALEIVDDDDATIAKVERLLELSAHDAEPDSP
jgi:hypothetical protein